MEKIHIDSQYCHQFISTETWHSTEESMQKAYQELVHQTGKGKEYLGWLHLPSQIDPKLLAEIEADAQRIQKIAKIFIVIGIGGSYLGARAVIEALHSQMPLLETPQKAPLVLYAGHQLSEDYLVELLALLDKHDYALTIISKSGTTTEPAVAFRILKNHLEQKYGKAQARERIIAITDKEKGALKQLANEEGYKTYVVPDEVGGRYSVLTPVGLLPIAVAGFDIRALIEGANTMRTELLSSSQAEKNLAMQYACLRTIFYEAGKKIELMVNYEPRLFFFTEWWKQLYGESEGKEGKGLFPAGVSFTSDLHSMGQYIQEGPKHLFETVLSINSPHLSLEVPHDKANLDGMNFVSGQRLSYINAKAQEATCLAHQGGGVPTIRICVPSLNEFYLGQLIYFYEFACGLSAYHLGVNPFDQPGVEAYKKNMFRLLGK
ncbi:MAG: glucose-6-phosphate isomerase [Bacteroidales bacterium]